MKNSSQNLNKLIHEPSAINSSISIPSVNIHLTNKCNFKCRYCFSHFNEIGKEASLKNEELKKIILLLKEENCKKVNIAGGEPLLYPSTGSILKFANQIGLTTSIVTNGSMITKEWLLKYGKYLKIIGISCDSANIDVMQALGRGGKGHLERLKKVFKEIKILNQLSDHQIFLKLNSVITKLNFKENMGDFIKKTGVRRWKIFQMLPIRGENHQYLNQLAISKTEFNEFVNRHLYLNNQRISVIPEYNDCMKGSYVMIDPRGRFYQNTTGKLIYSRPILEVGVKESLNDVGFSYLKFRRRGGEYRIDI